MRDGERESLTLRAGAAEPESRPGLEFSAARKKLFPKSREHRDSFELKNSPPGTMGTLTLASRGRGLTSCPTVG